ncbi:MAG TPA: PilZ domain-containing protein [Phycisphaerae bacterium]|nr:PilZ domain-containing protein [Phycisphaerae bacterium]HNU45516.1 PilZ domain-containing protein [Phycisphaerae bacterium]
MTTQQLSKYVQDGPIRQLICPDIEEPLPTTPASPERRAGYRYARHLPGTMTIGKADHRVTCLDIGYGGARVITSGCLQVAPGTPAELRITLGQRSYRDRFAVVQAEPVADGTAVHLAL